VNSFAIGAFFASEKSQIFFDLLRVKHEIKALFIFTDSIHTSVTRILLKGVNSRLFLALAAAADGHELVPWLLQGLQLGIKLLVNPFLLIINLL
jgi:hypothetical protein